MIARLGQYIREVMYDKKSGPLSGIVKICLLASSCIYAFLVWCNHFFYNARVLKIRSVPAVVISVGNITLGGTGKTPFVIALARYLAGRTKAAVLIRGYGEDEWKMLREKLGDRGAGVFVGRDRIKTAKDAIACGAQTVILDDGFQHRRLKRDLDIVLVDSSNPFGNGHLFPRGILRECPAGLKRAGVIVLTKTDKGKGNLTAIFDAVRKISPNVPIIKAAHRPKELFDLWTGEEEPLSALKGKKICLLSAICDGSYFRHTLEKTGAIAGLEFVFPDHYSYEKKDLDNILKECQKRGIRAIITTEKDAVKLKNFRPTDGPWIFVLSVEIEITEGEKALDAEIRRLYMRSGSQGH